MWEFLLLLWPSPTAMRPILKRSRKLKVSDFLILEVYDEEEPEFIDEQDQEH